MSMNAFQNPKMDEINTYPCPEPKFPKSCHRGQQESMMSPALPTDFKQMTTATVVTELNN